VLMRRAPHVVLDGLRAAADALGAHDLLISVHDGAAAASLQRALAERADLPGLRIDRTGTRFVAGEARALLSGAAGGAAVPSGRRVHAVHRGLGGRPTFLANVETFAQLGVLVRTGPGGYARTGSAAEPGTRLFTVGGSAVRAGVVEAPSGVPLDFLLDGTGGDVLLGGYHGSWTAAGPLALSAPDVAGAGLSLGAGVVLALDASTCPLGEVARIARWLAGESAGQCGPCLFGLPALAADLDAILRGDPAAPAAAARHLELLPGRGACSHPDGAVRFVKSALVHFRADVAAHLAGGCGRPIRGVLPLPVGDSS
jgi:NADH:ubiquinone oxidoreductase subunit F (NADH-binding)